MWLLKPDWLDQETWLEYSHFPGKSIIIVNIILGYVKCTSYGNVCVQGSDVKWYHYFLIFNGNISDVVENLVEFLTLLFLYLTLASRMLAMYLLRLYNGEPLYEATGHIGTLGMCIFGWP